jgi:hypothetical protein
VLTWLHQAKRDVLAVHPRDDLRRPLTCDPLRRPPQSGRLASGQSPEDRPLRPARSAGSRGY